MSHNDTSAKSFAEVVNVPINEALYKSAPPQFGHAVHKLFGFDPAYVNLNHGSYGSLPNPVRHAADALTTLIERNPDKFMRLTYQELLINTRERLADFIGADDKDEVVLVPNASHGINNVLRSFEWQEGDILIGTTTTYNSVERTMQYLSDLAPHPSIHNFTLNFPTTHAKILTSFREHLRSLPRPTSVNPNSPQKIVAVIDSIVSNPGVLLPWREMAQICKEEGVWSIIDAAHSIGQEMDMRVGSSKCDFWISNCHKWLLGKRSCAVFYVPKRNQHIIKSSFPTPYSYVSPYDERFPHFVTQFEWNGTTDFVPYLTVGAALDFRAWLGGETKINEYCHALALAGGKRMAEILGTEVMHGEDEDEMTLNMVNVLLPLPPSLSYTLAIDTLFRQRLLGNGGHNTYVAHFPHNGRVWVRVSAQVWNELEDFQYAARALGEVCEEVIKDFWRDDGGEGEK